MAFLRIPLDDWEHTRERWFYEIGRTVQSTWFSCKLEFTGKDNFRRECQLFDSYWPDIFDMCIKVEADYQQYLKEKAALRWTIEQMEKEVPHRPEATHKGSVDYGL